MKWQPAGHRVLIKPKEIQEVSQGGIIMASDIIEKEDFEVAEVVALGPTAFKEFGEAWCKVGDIVLFPKFSGKLMPNSKDCLRVINDEHVIAVGEQE